MISEPTYLAARMVSSTLEAHFTEHWDAGCFGKKEEKQLPPAAYIEAIIDAAFWASLQREEGYSPKISLAFLKPAQAGKPLIFGQKVRLTPYNLVKLSPAVTQPGIHLGVWHEDNDLYIWGSTHFIPEFCFVLEVVEPGLLVVKHKQIGGFGKFVNVAILKGDQIKIVDKNSIASDTSPSLLTSLLGHPMSLRTGEAVNVLVELAASIRSHGKGALVLVVPPGTQKWRESVIHPISYPVIPAYEALADLLQMDEHQRGTPEWQESFLRAVDIVGGFTAVDGATILTQQHSLLAFGAKVARAAMSDPAEQVMMTEPVSGSEARIVHPAKIGGTRHLAAAQFVHDQRDSIALVASQDGRFTVFVWSEKLSMVHAHRIDVLLL
ncbi:hypothetical protein EDD80_10699 [Anseongella ginsenosidimutans]|uniref:Probable sensor domain-containing protein n=1 Tax=Anseongella ginsenosidimutans TaxID=496056 RepID=A0A4R3KRM7_9SPHI|nr:hypothetical protein [Anseongella ginsenosidimutans]QEC52238.1 hypothetical protein FRZ59_07740 [Anseongella ginsenosidimutans]TCS86789.1 hypothetical protein EDD80_10699 [Anseongella ginsenosidimutans]